jgi:hypothetical protein
MRLTTYAYPWDLARLGVERTLQRIADEGIEALDLAATYHPIDSVSPREGLRLFSNARGAVYFPARTERYGRIKPLMHAVEVCAAWPEAARHVVRLGIDLNAWTITLFQPWIRDAHPECARVLPSGDRSGSGVCPANEDVRDLIVSLAEDVVDQFGVRLVRLESVMPMFDFDWLRPRTLVTLSPSARTLLNLCFCSACVRKAEKAGLDVESVRRTANEVIRAEINNAPLQASADRSAQLMGNAELNAFACAYVRSSTELVSAVAIAVRGKARVSVNAAAAYDLLLGDTKEAELLAEFVAAADQVALHPGHSRNELMCDLANAAAPVREISALIPLVGARSGPGPALQARVGSSEAIAKEAVRLGVTELSLYNYGLVRESDVAPFIAAMRIGFS